jgi:hypothetical protein
MYEALLKTDKLILSCITFNKACPDYTSHEQNEKEEQQRRNNKGKRHSIQETIVITS